MKTIAAITMSRNDLFFLEKWIAYYGEKLGKENLYVFIDGEDQKTPQNSDEINLTVLSHKPMKRAEGDKFRINFINQFANSLFEKYDIVIGTDCDEFLVVEPKLKFSLREYLSSLSIFPAVSALGIDVGHHLEKESQLDTSKTILSQRKFALLSSRYTKPIILTKPSVWGSGFHRIKGHNFEIDKNLFLFHLGYCDAEILKEKWSDASRISGGWEKHLKRRAKTIDLVTRKKAKSGDKLILKARKIQTFCRPFFAWNKPSMGNWKPIIEIPERFKHTI